MDAMMFIDLVKCENEGTKRIRAAMQAANLPEPKFEQKEVAGGIVRVTLRNNQNLREQWVDADVAHIVGQVLAANLTDYQKRIINFIAEHGRINVTTAMKLMAPKEPRWGTAGKNLKELEEMGIVRHVSRYQRDPTAHYVLATPGAPKA